MVKLIPRPSILFTLMVTVPHLVVYMLAVITAHWIDRIFFPESFSNSRIGKLSLPVRNSWLRGILRLHDIEVEVLGPYADQLKNAKGTVFVSNHQSIVDILVQMYALPDNVAFVAKKELSQIPIFGWAASAVGIIYIDRKKGANNRSLNDVSDYLQRGGNIIIYPEGTRSSDGQLLPFKRGAFVLAIQNKAPIVPITVKGTRQSSPKGSITIAPSKVSLIIEAPLLTAELHENARFELAEQVRTLISKNL